VKLNCDPVLRQVTEIAQMISELRSVLPGPPEERTCLVGEVIAGSDPRCTAFARTGNLRLPKTSSTPASLSLDLESERVAGRAEARVTFGKPYSFKSYVLFNSGEFNLSELL
jgi:hypothetical protein